MRRLHITLILLLQTIFLSNLSMQAQTSSSLSNNGFRLKKIIPVAGRQGIAADSNFYYVSSSTALYKYDKQGNLIRKNEKPFTKLAKAANHFGDIDVHNQEIYTGIEWFVDGVGKDIQIAVYDANTLELKRSLSFDPASGQKEVSGVTIDKERNMAWMTDWVEGKYIYRYDLTTGAYAGKIHLQPVPQYQQGIFYKNGKVFITADDGDADFHEPDHIYMADVTDMGKTAAQVTLFKTCDEFIRAGEIEGLCIDPANEQLLVLTNRGSRIVLGMVKGFYPGYESELHELYIYEPILN